MKDLVKEKLIEKTSMPDNIPLSYTQERLWFLDKIGLGHQYHIPSVLEIRTLIDIQLIEKTFQMLIDRHESFRTVFVEEEDVPYQKILNDIAFKIETEDLRGLSEDQKSKTLHRLIENFTNRPFDLKTGPLIRVAIYVTADDRSVLAINMHHIISDGWSAGIMTREFSEIYDALQNDRDPNLEELPLQYADYTLWQRDVLDGAKLKEDILHWKNHLKGYEDIDLPTDFPRPVKLSGRGSQETVSLGQSVCQQLMEYKKLHGKSSFAIFLSGVYALLHYYSRQNSINIGVPMANRMHPQLGNIIGFFANTVVNRIVFKPGMTFSDLIEAVNAEVMRSHDYQHVPFEKIVEAVNPSRDQSRTPLFQVMVNHINLMDKSDGMQDTEIKSLESEYSQAKFDLKFTFSEARNGETDFTLEYSIDLFARHTITNMMKQLDRLMSQMLLNPDKKLTDVRLLSESGERKILKDYNKTEVNFPSDKTIHGLFAARADKYPDNTALTFRDKSYSYHQLNAESDKVASLLSSKGVEAGDLVALFMDRSDDLMISMLGILKSGAAYVPIGVENPDQRIAYMLSDSNTPLVITDKEHSERVSKLVSNPKTEIVCMDKDLRASIEEGTGDHQGSDPSSVAYMIYTSGSTGNPKGVLVPHLGVVNYLYEVANNYRFLEIDINRLEFAFFGNVSFDATATSFLAPLVSGGTCHIYEPELSPQESLKKAFEDDTINAVKLTPSHLKMLNELKITPSQTMKMVIIGGEALPAATIKLALSKGIRMYAINQYGPTECSIASVAHLYNPANKYGTDVIIGKPMANNQVYILDAHGNPVPHGIPGELYISGTGVTKGYHGKPELTAEKFVDNPVRPGTISYRTGDLVRWLPGGDIEFLGRIDEQVKIRGYRVELGEIENLLTDFDEISQSCVVFKKDEQLLVAYYTSQSDIDNALLKIHLSGKLPDYMIPVSFIRIDEIPLTPNGKADRRSLAARSVTLVSSSAYVAPRNETEEALVRIWEEMLQADQVGVNDNFFELGGHSLLATRIISRINKELKLQLPVGIIFSADQVSRLAEAIDGREGKEVSTDRPSATERPEIIPLSYAQERLWFLNELGQGVLYHMPHIYEIAGEIRLDIMQQAIDRLVSRHESFRTYFKNEQGTPSQKIDNKLRIPVRYVRLNGLSEEEQQSKIDGLVGEIVKAPFDLEYGPLIRFMLVELKQNHYIFGFCIHHIITDGWSNTIFNKELIWNYENLLNKTDPVLPELNMQYADYAIWQRRMLNEDKMARELAHWKQHLAGYQDLNLPTDFPRPLESTGKGSLIFSKFDKDKMAGLARFARENAVTTFNSLTTAVYILLNAYSGQEDITIGMPIANRNYSELEDLIGFFANTIVNRVQIKKDETINTLLQKVKAEQIRSQDHQEVPFERVVDAIQPERELSKTPLFQVLVNYMVNKADRRSGEGINLKPVSAGHDISKFDLSFAFFDDTENNIILSLEYSTDLFRKETIDRMMASLGKIIDQMVSGADQKLSEINLLTEEERNDLLTISDKTRRPESRRTIHSLVSESCRRNSQRKAVVFGDQSINYEELESLSDSLAAKLIGAGIGRNDLVAVCLERSPEAVISALAVLKAGGGYLPVSPAFPEDRKQFILKDSGAKYLITRSVFSDQFAEDVCQITLIDSVDQMKEQFTASEFESHQDDLATSYVIYTSGSTGKPKGVLQTHRTIVNLIGWQIENYGRSADRPGVTSQFAAISFDVSVQEMFYALINGDTLTLIPEEMKLDPVSLVKFISSAEVNYTYLPTAYLDYFCIEANKMGDAINFPQLKRIIVAGEALKITDEIRKFFSIHKEVRLENQYGPSETHVVTAHTMQQDVTSWEYMPSIGSPIANTSVYLLDETKRLVPKGAIGELYFGGAGVAKEYLSNEKLTTEKFIQSPFSEERLYKTGDLARWTHDGNLQFIGRTDHQVKIRGFRIEPGEIEARLSAFNGLDQASVIVKEIDSNLYLMAFYVSQEDIAADQLREHLSAALPDYMIPAAFTRVEQIPLTQNGKTDVRSLLNIPVDFVSGRKYVEPENETERKLEEIWCGLLKQEKISVVDNFFEVGGHSLLATQLISRINSEFKIEMHLSSLFKKPTIRGCADVIAGSETVENDNSLTNFIDSEDELTF